MGGSDESDEQYEGCLSLFDVRGIVARPLCIEVEHTTLDGRTHLTSFERAAGCLWAHEIDHLEGRLYWQRLRAPHELVPVERYAGTGSSWRYWNAGRFGAAATAADDEVTLAAASRADGCPARAGRRRAATRAAFQEPPNRRRIDEDDAVFDEALDRR